MRKLNLFQKEKSQKLNGTKNKKVPYTIVVKSLTKKQLEIKKRNKFGNILPKIKKLLKSNNKKSTKYCNAMSDGDHKINWSIKALFG